MLPTLDLRRLATRTSPGPQSVSADDPTTTGLSLPVSPRPHASVIPNASSDLRQAVKSVVSGQAFDNAFLSSSSAPDECLVQLCTESANIRRVFLWGQNPYPLQSGCDEMNRATRERQYPNWWTDKIEWLPEDIEAVPRVVDLLITDHSPWTCRFVQPRCCLLLGDAASAKRDEDYRWTSGPGWLLGLRCRPRTRHAMNYRTIYSVNGGGENEDPFGWY